MRNDELSPNAPDDAELRALFDALPREEPVRAGGAEDVLWRLKHDGVMPSRARRRWPVQAAAALLLLATGAWVGWHAGRRGSIEDLLARNDLTLSERVLLLQRAGSAYVTAAQGYASATARVDSSAVEIASRVLLGAAHAVARSQLDAGVAARLTSVLQPPPAAAPPRPTIWF